MMGLLDHLPVLPVLLPSFTAIVLLLIGDHGGSEHNLRKLVWSSRIAIVFGADRVGDRDPARGAGRRWRPAGLPHGRLAGAVRHRAGGRPAVGHDAAADIAGRACRCCCMPAAAGPAMAGISIALFQFQLMGLNGAFVTGDLFNLFVFFEVLLIASYVLMMHGQGRERLRVGVHYVVLNLTASALFLIGVALLYALTGTLNMADLALRVPLVTGPDAAVLQVAAPGAAGGVRLQGGAGAAVGLAAGHLCGGQCAGGGVVRDHDQGRRVCDLARARRHFRRVGGHIGASGGAAAAAAGGGHQRGRRDGRTGRADACRGWWPG